MGEGDEVSTDGGGGVNDRLKIEILIFIGGLLDRNSIKQNLQVLHVHNVTFDLEINCI